MWLKQLFKMNDSYTWWSILLLFYAMVIFQALNTDVCQHTHFSDLVEFNYM